MIAFKNSSLTLNLFLLQCTFIFLLQLWLFFFKPYLHNTFGSYAILL